MNRLEVDSVFVRNALKLDANHLVVVYKQQEGHIERRIVQGPMSLMLMSGKPLAPLYLSL